MDALTKKEKIAREKKESAECILTLDGFTYWCKPKTGMRKFRGRTVPTVWFKDVFTNRLVADWYSVRSQKAILIWKNPEREEAKQFPEM